MTASEGPAIAYFACDDYVLASVDYVEKRKQERGYPRSLVTWRISRAGNASVVTHAEDVFTVEYPIGRRVAELSKVQTSPAHSEKIFAGFVEHLDGVAARNAATTKTASAR